jgi:hypothetical protein
MVMAMSARRDRTAVRRLDEVPAPHDCDPLSRLIAQEDEDRPRASPPILGCAEAMLRLCRMRLRRLVFGRRTAVQQDAVRVLIDLLQPGRREELREVVAAVVGMEGISFRAASRLFGEKFGLKLSDKTVSDLWKRVVAQYTLRAPNQAEAEHQDALIESPAPPAEEAVASGQTQVPSVPVACLAPATAEVPEPTISPWTALLILLLCELPERRPTSGPDRCYGHAQAARRLAADLGCIP